MAGPNSRSGFGIFNGLAPEQGPKALKVDVDFSSIPSQVINLLTENQNGQLQFVQTICVDNLNNTSPVVITVGVTGQRITVPAGGGVIQPMFSPDQTNITVTSVAGAGNATQIIFLNVPLPAWSYSAVAEGAQAPLSAGADRSGSIVAANVPQAMVAANPNRRSLTGQNISANDLWINETGGVAAIATPGSYRIATFETFAIATNRAVSVIGGTLGQSWTATET